MDGPIVIDVDLGPRLLLDSPDSLTAWADYCTDLVRVDLYRLDTRRKWREVKSGLRERLEHLVHDIHAAFSGLCHGLRQHLRGESFNLDIHLERGNTIGG